MAFEAFFNPEEERRRPRLSKLTIIVFFSMLTLLLIVIIAVTLITHRGRGHTPSTEMATFDQINPEPERTLVFHYSYNKTQSASVNISCKIVGSEDNCSDYMKELERIEERELFFFTGHVTSLEVLIGKWTISIGRSSLKSDLKIGFFVGSVDVEDAVYEDIELENWDMGDMLGTTTFSKTFSNSTEDETEQFHCFEIREDLWDNFPFEVNNCSTIQDTIRSDLVEDTIHYMKAVMGIVQWNGTASFGAKSPWLTMEVILWGSTDGETIRSNIEKFNENDIAVCNCHAANPMKDINAAASYQHCLDGLKISKEVQLRMEHLRCGSQADKQKEINTRNVTV